MALYVNCEACGAELMQPGAVLLGPPQGGVCVKQHLCQDCYVHMLDVIHMAKLGVDAHVNVRRFADATPQWPQPQMHPAEENFED